MGINIQPRTDVSYLFSGLGSGAANVAGSNFLSQYASIKNGSYAKLMKAYYNETGSSAVNNLVNKNKVSNSISKEDAKRIADVQKTTDELKESADALLEKGKDSLFAKKDIVTRDENGIETTAKGYDTNAIYKALDEFVKDYNDVIDSVNQVEYSSVVNRASTMVNASIVNKDMLNSIGITINEDSTLSLDKSIFEKADMGRVKNLFQDVGSYGYSVSAQASLINFSADQAAAKADTYTVNGTYNNVYNTGNIFNSYF